MTIVSRLAGVAVLGVLLAGCGGSDSPAATPTSARPTVTAMPSPTQEVSEAPTDPLAGATRAFQDVAAAGKAYDEAFLAWASGDTPTGPDATVGIMPLQNYLKDLDVQLEDLTGRPGVASLRAAIVKYQFALDRARVLLGEGETQYAKEKPAKGSLDCFNQQAAALWKKGAKALYAGTSTPPPGLPIDDAGNCR